MIRRIHWTGAWLDEDPSVFVASDMVTVTKRNGEGG